MDHIHGRRKRQREQPGSSNITILWGGGGALIKQLFHSGLLDMRVIAISVLRASLTIYHLISNKREWNTVNYI